MCCISYLTVSKLFFIFHSSCKPPSESLSLETHVKALRSCLSPGLILTALLWNLSYNVHIQLVFHYVGLLRFSKNKKNDIILLRGNTSLRDLF